MSNWLDLVHHIRLGGRRMENRESATALARLCIGMVTLLAAFPSAFVRAQGGGAPPRPIFANNAPVIPHEALV
jgi:hypothetical protein